MVVKPIYQNFVIFCWYTYSFLSVGRYIIFDLIIFYVTGCFSFHVLFMRLSVVNDQLSYSCSIYSSIGCMLDSFFINWFLILSDIATAYLLILAAAFQTPDESQYISSRLQFRTIPWAKWQGSLQSYLKKGRIRFRLWSQNFSA